MIACPLLLLALYILANSSKFNPAAVPCKAGFQFVCNMDHELKLAVDLLLRFLVICFHLLGDDSTASDDYWQVGNHVLNVGLQQCVEG